LSSLRSPGRPRFIIPWFLIAILAALFTIAACGDDETPTATTRPGVTPSPTATTGSGTTPSPTATAARTPTAAARVPVQARLRIVNSPDAHQYTVPYAGNQVTWSKMPAYEHLIGHDIKSNEEIPELAEKWSVAADGKTWTFNLKRNVPFYKDGKATNDTFSAKDVLLSWDLLIGEKGVVNTKLSQSPARWESLFGLPANWATPDDYTVVLTSPNVNLDLGFNVSDVWESGILSADHWTAVGGEEGYQADPIGTGPFTFVERQINQYYLHKRVANHWRKTPDFEEVQMFQIAEAATRVAMLFAKEADMIPLVQDQRAKILQGGFRIQKSTLPSVNQGVTFIHYRPEWYCVDGKPPQGQSACGARKGYDPNDPLRKPEVRVALNHAINRTEFNQVFYNGEGFPLVDEYPTWRTDWQDRWAPVPGPNGKTGKEGGWPYPFDVAKAKDMLAKAGYPNGFTTRLNCLRSHNVIPDWPGHCEAMVKYFAAIGVTARLETDNDFADFRAKAVAADTPNWMYSSSPGYSPICNRISFNFVWTLGLGYREWAEVDELWTACRSATTIATRDAAAIKFADAWLQKGFSIPLVWVFSSIAYNPAIIAKHEANFSNFGTARYLEWIQAQVK